MVHGMRTPPYGYTDPALRGQFDGQTVHGDHHGDGEEYSTALFKWAGQHHPAMLREIAEQKANHEVAAIEFHS